MKKDAGSRWATCGTWLCFMFMFSPANRHSRNMVSKFLFKKINIYKNIKKTGVMFLNKILDFQFSA